MLFETRKIAELSVTERETLRVRMYQAWRTIDASDAILAVFTCGGAVYYMPMDTEQFEQYTMLDIASRGAGYSLRMNVSTRDGSAARLVNQGATMLCSVKYFNDVKREVRKATGKKYNDGEIVEYIFNQQQSIEWHKDNRASDTGGDIIIDGVDYQVKAHVRKGATLASEKRLYNAGVWARV